MLNRLFKRKPAKKATAPPGLARRQNLLFASTELQQDAMKSLTYSAGALDFINDTSGTGDVNYTDRQLEMAYRVSTYLYSGLNLVAMMLRSVPLAVEKQVGPDWERQSEAHPLNLLFARSGGKLLQHMYLYEAVYGNTLVYKHKTRRAVIAEREGKRIPFWHQGGVAGFHVIPNVNWSLDENPLTTEIFGFNLSVADKEIGNRNYLRRDECIYHNEFDLREPNKGASLVSRAIHEAVTDAAIGRWTAHYFMSGAMPLLLINVEGDDIAQMTETDLERYKSRVEQTWQGIYGEYALRAKFTDRKLNVNQVGIKAEEVTAPELDKKALNKIAAVIRIAPDLIVPPEGGSDNARHKFLIKQAWDMTVIPTVGLFLDAFNEDLGLNEIGYRLVVDKRKISALQAERSDDLDTEIKAFTGTVQTFGETRQRLDMDENEILAPLEDLMYQDNKFKTVARIVREANMVPSDVLQYVGGAWNDGAIKRSEYRLMMGLKPVLPGDKDGYKYEVVPDPAAMGGQGAPPPTDSPAPTTPDAPPDAPAPSPAPAEDEKPAPAQVNDDGDKAAPLPENDTSDVNESEAPALPEVEYITTGVDVPLVTAPVEVELPADAHAPCPAYISLWLNADVQLVSILDQLKAQMSGDAVEWSDPRTLHITLVYVEDIDDATLKRVQALLPTHMSPLTVRCGPVTAFSGHDGRTVIALSVEPDAALIQLQNKIAVACAVYGLPLSEYSATDRYMPHVTLGYAQANTSVPAFAATVGVAVPCVYIQRDNYQVVGEIQLTGAPPPTPDPRVVYVEPTNPAPAEPNDPDHLAKLEDMIGMFREKWVMAIQRWAASGGIPYVLPKTITEAVQVGLQQQPNQRPAVFAMAVECVNAGDFDEHAQREDNPIMTRLTPPKAQQPNADAELDAWEKAALHSPAKALNRFEVKLVPLSIEQGLRAALSESADKTAVRAAFAKAREAYKADFSPHPVSEDDLALLADRLADDPALVALFPPDEETPVSGANQ